MTHEEKSYRSALPWQTSGSTHEGYAPISIRSSDSSPSCPLLEASRSRQWKTTSLAVLTAVIISMGTFAQQAWLGESLYFPDLSLSLAIRHASPRPDYYAQPGLLVMQKGASVNKHEVSRFLEMDQAMSLQERGQSGLEADLKLGDGWDDIQALHKSVKLNHLVNKTVVLLGDSVDRFFVDHFCRNIVPAAKLTYNALHIPPNDLSTIVTPDNYYDEFSEPHLCTLPDYLGGLKVWSVMFYGVLTASENEWAFKDQTRAPRKVENKLKLFNKALKKKGVSDPDLVITSSGLWDLATANIRDVRDNAPDAEILPLETVMTIRERSIQLLQAIRQHWPQSKIMYRTIHHVTPATTGDWFLANLPLSASGKPYAAIPRTPMATAKVWQINAVTQSLFREQGKIAINSTLPSIPKFDLFDVARVTQAYTGDFADYVHLQATGLALYAQMLMFYMRLHFA